VLQSSNTGVRRPAAVVTLALAAALTLGACESGSGDDSKTKDSKASSAPSVINPGRPGEPAKLLTAEEAAKARPDDTPNPADFAYTEMMIIHHGQALVMTDLVEGRAESPQIKRIADRISAAQKPEITAMEGWLKRYAGQKPKSGGHDHGSMKMPGMATDAQLKELRESKGKAFDRMFLKLMITHHEGAVAMAADVLSDGANVFVQEMANDVMSQQSAEIGRMQKM
jgi:uncharacterized protein (DUF305 family)